MPVVVVATMTAKPESGATVRDAFKQPIEHDHDAPPGDRQAVRCDR